jgi:hypothetical protein
MAEALGYLLIEAAIGAGLIEGTAAAIGGATLISGLTVAGGVGSAAILSASIGLALATAPEVPKAGDGSQPIRQAIPPRPRGYGRARVAGAYMLFEADDNDNSHDVVALHQGRIARVVHHFLNDDMVELNASGFVLHNLNGPDDGRYDTGDPTPSTTYIEHRLGLATETAYADVVTALPALWSNAHRGDGIASLYVKCVNIATEFIPRTYPRGLPKPSVVADLSPVWDPRDETQHREDPDTWVVSSNPIVQLIDYLTHPDGMGLSYDDVIAPVLPALIAKAHICDEPVVQADGSTRPRYRSNGWAFLTTDPAEVLPTILATCDGWLAETGDGTLAVEVGKYAAPDVVLNDDHILSLSLEKGRADEELVNEVQFTYTAPGANWRDCPGVSVRDEASISELGVVRSKRLQLPWVQGHGQARHLAKRLLDRETALRGQIVTTLYGLTALGKRWINVRSRRIADLANAVIEVSRVRVDLATARLTFDYTIVNPNSIDAPPEEVEPPAYVPVPDNVTAADSGASNQVNVEFDAVEPEQPWLYYVVDYRLGTSAPWTREVFLADNDLVPIGGGRVRLRTSPVPAGAYAVRVAAVGRQGIKGSSLNTNRFAAAVATTADITLSGGQTIQGVSAASGVRVLVNAQTNPAENGIWVADSGGPWTRASDMDGWPEIVGAVVRVTGGTFANRTFLADVAPGGSVGTTPVAFVLPSDIVIDPDLVWAPGVDGVIGVVVA